MIVTGASADGFKAIADARFGETFHSICVLGGRPHLLADTRIRVLSPALKLVDEIDLPEGLDSPLLIDAADGVLWYFAHKGVARRTARGWEVLALPDEVWANKSPARKRRS